MGERPTSLATPAAGCSEVARQLHLAKASLRPRAAVPGMGVLDVSVSRMRVGPGDLDFYGIVNNGTYLQMMDVARSNYIADVGGFGPLNSRRWFPVVAAQTVTYKRSLRLGQAFELHTRVVGWDPRVAYLEQLFLHRGHQVARGWVAGRFLTRGSGERVPAPEVIGLIDAGAVAPPLPRDMADWARAVGVAHRGAGAQGG